MPAWRTSEAYSKHSNYSVQPTTPGQVNKSVSLPGIQTSHSSAEKGVVSPGLGTTICMCACIRVCVGSFLGLAGNLSCCSSVVLEMPDQVRGRRLLLLLPRIQLLGLDSTHAFPVSQTVPLTILGCVQSRCLASVQVEIWIQRSVWGAERYSIKYQQGYAFGFTHRVKFWDFPLGKSFQKF